MKKCHYQNLRPTLQQFRTFTREAFTFLLDEYDFVLLPWPPDDDVNPYVVEFCGNGIAVKVMGISWGFSAQVTLRREGEPWPELSLFLLIPEADQVKSVTISGSSQLTDVATAAAQLRHWGGAALRGDLVELQGRFAEYSKALQDAQVTEQEHARIQGLIDQAREAAKRKEFARVIGLLARERDLPTYARKLLEYVRSRQQ